MRLRLKDTYTEIMYKESRLKYLIIYYCKENVKFYDIFYDFNIDRYKNL